jgi:tetratricopeptide (TPR) repeat protein
VNNTRLYKWLSLSIAGLAVLMLALSLIILLKPAEPLPKPADIALALPFWLENSSPLTTNPAIVPAYFKAAPTPAPSLNLQSTTDTNSTLISELLQSGDFATAITKLNRLVAEDPFDVQALSDFGVTLFLRGADYEGTTAISWLEQAVSLKPSAQNLGFLALAYLEDYQPQKALTIASKAVNLDPQSATARIALAVVTKDSSELVQAQKLELLPFWSEWAQVKILPEEVTSAKLDRLLENYPRLSHLHTLKGDRLREKGVEERKKALNYYTQAIELNPHNVPAYSGLGWVYFSLGDYAKAAENFAQSLKHKADYPPALVGQGYSKLANRQPDAAISFFSKAILKDSTNAEAYNGLAAANLNKGSIEQVVTWAELAIKYSPNYADPYYHKGRALYEQRNYPRAVSLLEKAVKLTPSRPHYYEALAFAYYANGQKAEAKQTAQNGLVLKPGNPTLDKLLKLI